MNVSATDWLVNSAQRAIKCPYLDNLSITTKMTEFPRDSGNYTIKSIEMSYQICEGIGNGCNRPPG